MASALIAVLAFSASNVYGSSDDSSNPLNAVNATSCPGLDYSTLLIGTLQSMYSFIDPMTGLLHDRRDFRDGGNIQDPSAGVFPDLPNVHLSDANNLTAQFTSGAALTLDYGLRLTYLPGNPMGFGYLAISALLNLDAPRISGLRVRGRASHGNAPLEVKLECEDGGQQIWDATFPTDTFGWVDLTLPVPTPCDLKRVNKLTFAGVDAKLRGVVGEVVWDIDHAAFTVDPSQIGQAHILPIECEGTYWPLPCRGIPTNVDNVGYGLAALGVAACVRSPVSVPGFGSPEEAILRALDTLGSWPKWSGEDPVTGFRTQTGFPWTWFSPANGFPPRDQLNVFALDQAHLASGLQILEQAAGSHACHVDARFREMIRVKARALRLGMDWRLLVHDADLATEWRARPDGGGCVGLCGIERARGNEAILRVFQSVASHAVPTSHFERLSCEVTKDDRGHTWYKTFNEQPGEDPTRCSATFVQQAPLMFLDASRLPKSPKLPVHDHLQSVTELIRAHALALPQLDGWWSDCELPDGSGYVTACQIPPSVVTPQAAILGLEFLPEAAQALCKFHRANVDRPYELGGELLNRGMRDSYSLDTKSAGDAVFIGLDQARNALALFNVLYPNFNHTGLPVVRALFAADAGAGAAYGQLRHSTVCQALSVKPNSQDFGRVLIGSSAERSFTVRNAGAVTVAGTVTAEAPFSVVSGTSFRLNPRQTQMLSVRFSPTHTGTSSGRVMFESTNGESVGIPVSGAGILPDLSVSLVTFTPATVLPGGKVSITHGVRNIATAPGNAPASVSRLLLARNQSAVTEVADLGVVNVPALNAGATRSVTQLLTVPALTPPGMYFVVARADDPNVIAELNEANNTGTSTTRLLVGSDIVVKAVATATSARIGTQVNVKYTLKNQGAGSTGAFAVSLTLVPTSDLTGVSDIAVGAGRSGIVLGAGATVSFVDSVTVPSGLAPGPYRVRVIADSGHAVAEADEGNNMLLTNILNIVR